MKIGYVQTSPAFGRREDNFQQVEALLEGVRADLIVLPELFATGYAFASRDEAFDLAEPRDGETAAFLVKCARAAGGAVAGGYAERDGDALYNAALMADGSGVIGAYRKLHLFNREKLWFSPGNIPLSVYGAGDARVGMMICFDWYFPEAARTLALMGADIIAHPSNLVMPYCQGAMKTRCLENRIYAVTANRIGVERRGGDELTFTGASQITAPAGDVLSSAPLDRTHVDVVEVDSNTARDKKINPLNDILSDRREEFYFRDGNDA